MESEGGGIVAAALPAQHSTLRDNFVASDLTDGATTTCQQPVSNITLGAVLNGNKKSHRHNYNLVVRNPREIVRDGETKGPHNRKKPWKSLKEKLKGKKQPHGQSQSQNVNSHRRDSLVSSLQSDEQREGERPTVVATANHPVTMSLKDLIEETDRQAGESHPSYILGDDDEEDEEEEVVSDSKGEFSCCVCMVRHKGAAFIPCGHTFCRFCSRQLFVQRGNCPLCNNYILEVLDIF